MKTKVYLGEERVKWFPGGADFMLSSINKVVCGLKTDSQWLTHTSFTLVSPGELDLHPSFYILDTSLLVYLFISYSNGSRKISNSTSDQIHFN